MGGLIPSYYYDCNRNCGNTRIKLLSKHLKLFDFEILCQKITPTDSAGLATPLQAY